MDDFLISLTYEEANAFLLLVDEAEAKDCVFQEQDIESIVTKVQEALGT